MRSTARFLEGTLLGVALGVGLGFLVFRKSTREGLKNLWPAGLESVSPQGATPPSRSEGEAVEPAPWTVEPADYEVAAAGLATESEVLVSPEALGEPLTGAEWEPSAAATQEEEVSEETMPPIPSEMEVYTSVEVEPLDAESIPVWAEIPSPEVEVEPPDAEAAVEELQAEDVMVQEAAVEEPQVEEPAVEEVEIEAAPIPTPADDLKARIEETRRRIRRELEQPFVIGGGVAATEASLSSGIEPAIGDALAVEPSPEEQSASDTQEPTVTALGESDVTGETEGEEQSSAAEGPGVDYEAMRGRIEETRSRLKAKAFDAMMTGESALLGRDPDGVDVKLPTPTEVDGEIVQTIEDTLREEES